MKSERPRLILPGELPHAQKRIRFLNGDRGMKCQRCLRDEATYRVYTDAMDMKVGFACAEEACRLGIAVEVLHSSEKMKQYRVS